MPHGRGFHLSGGFWWLVDWQEACWGSLVLQAVVLVGYVSRNLCILSFPVCWALFTVITSPVLFLWHCWLFPLSFRFFLAHQLLINWFIIYEESICWAREMVHKSVCATLTKDLGMVPYTHVRKLTNAVTPATEQLMPSSGSWEKHTYSWNNV